MWTGFVAKEAITEAPAENKVEVGGWAQEIQPVRVVELSRLETSCLNTVGNWEETETQGLEWPRALEIKISK